MAVISARSRAAAARRVLYCLVAMAAISSSSSPPWRLQARAEQDCYEERDGAVHHCWKYIRGDIDPPVSPWPRERCCQIVKDADVACICNAFTDAQKAKISLVKWVAVAARCGNALPSGTDCAGYKVPVQLPNA